MAQPSLSNFLRNLLGLATHDAGADGPVAALPSPEATPSSYESSYDGRLPESSMARVRQIHTLLSELEGRSRSQALFDGSAELQRIKTTHLPSLLESYASIPPEHRAEIFRSTGRSASFQLNERLDKILNHLNDMSRQLARGNLDVFSENIRFIDMRYDPSPFD
jgi:hypothetical protein